MSGINSEDSKHISGDEATSAILELFQNNNFDVYTNIFSISTSTKQQLPSILNFITSQKQYDLEKLNQEKFLYLKNQKTIFKLLI